MFFIKHTLNVYLELYQNKMGNQIALVVQIIKRKTLLHCKLLQILFNEKERLSGKYNNSQSTHRENIN